MTTLGRLLIDEALPEPLRGTYGELDKPALSRLLERVAREHPERYAEVSHRLATIGQQVAYRTGGTSFGLEHLKPAKAALATRQRILTRMQNILGNDNLTDEQRAQYIERAVGQEVVPQQKAILEESLAEENPLAHQVKSGTRGNAGNLASLRGSDLLYVDHRRRVIPLPVLHSYSEGLTPIEYFAGTYGARRGVLSTKLSTAETGYLGKILNRNAHRVIVTDHDREDPEPTLRGLPVDTLDPHNEGTLLARETAGYPRNTVLTPKLLRDLHGRGHERLLVRSPLTSSPPEGGVYARDVGVREFGNLPGRGEQVGLLAASALAEPLAQGALCLADGTLVRMADWSVRPIEKIKPGDWVLGADADGRTFPSRVIRIHENGVKNCYSTTFRYPGRKCAPAELCSTLDHNLLAIRNTANQLADVWNGIPALYPVGIQTRNLNAVLPTGFKDSGLPEESFALICGLLLGDGCYTKSVHGVHLSCYDESLAEEVTHVFAQHNLKLVKLKGHKGYYRLSSLIERRAKRHPKSGRVLPGYRNPAMAWLQERGMLHKYAHEKEIPKEAFGWSNRSVADLLSGLCVTDGSVYVTNQRKDVGQPYFGFCSTSRTMAEQVRQLLMWRFGIYPTELHERVPDNDRASYSFQIATEDSLRRLAKAVPLYGKKKRVLTKYLSAWKCNHPRPYYRLPRDNQRHAGWLPTRDLEVDNADHLFVLASGLIVSNSEKHSGGVAGGGRPPAAGFPYIDSLVNPPKKFPGGATHAQSDGQVSRVTAAPAGGHFVAINGADHYVPGDQAVKVKPGDTVEAGDQLSDGFGNPAELVQHKGLGEGRRYFVNAFRDAYHNTGIKVDRRNVELLARGLMDHVQLTDEVGDGVPGDIVPYSQLENQYAPRHDAETRPIGQMLGRYLEQPYLHYTIGTKVRPSVLKELRHFGVKEVTAHRSPPPFQPIMIRGAQALEHDPDFLTKQLGSGQKATILEAAHRGGHSNRLGTSFVPSLAYGVNFGHEGLTAGK